VFAVAVGDRVLTSKYGGTEVKVGDVDYILVDEDDILGIVE
jgi:chaperonin GroES